MVQLTAPTGTNPLPTSTSNIVGQFIRTERERKSLSQKALGQMFNPPVTTQFISNIERGVTPLPPVHIQTLTKIFELNEEAFLDVFEREYMTKLSQQLGRSGYDGATVGKSIFVAGPHVELLRKFADAFQAADADKQEAMKRAMEPFLKNA